MQVLGMGRLLRGRGSQKTCLNGIIPPIRGRMGGLLDLEDKKGKSPGRIFRSRGFFLPAGPDGKRTWDLCCRFKKEESYFGYRRSFFKFPFGVILQEVACEQGGSCGQSLEVLTENMFCCREVFVAPIGFGGGFRSSGDYNGRGRHGSSRCRKCSG